MNDRKRNLEERILDLLYPRHCPVCDGILPADCFVCPACERKLPYIRTRRCAKCGKPVEEEDELCEDCRKTEHLFDEGMGIFLYDETMKKTMAAFKFKGRAEYGDSLGFLMADNSRDKLALWKPDLLVPVPIHKEKLRTRGYNQAEKLACSVSRTTGIPVKRNAVVRTGRTRAMKNLGAEERQENLEEAFRQGTDSVRGRRILIIDDIYTTGSTVDAVSKVLRSGGALLIAFLTVCIGKGFMIEY